MTETPSPGTSTQLPDETEVRHRWVDERRQNARAERPQHRWRRVLPVPGVPHAETWRERHWSSRLLHWIGEVAGHAGSGLIASAAVVGWGAVGFGFGFPVWWQTVLYSVTASVTFVMVFVIQHTQERQTAATQRKLDELIRVSSRADNTLIAVEEAGEEHLQALTHLNISDRESAVAPSPDE